MSVVITELYRLLFGRSLLQNGDVIEMAEHGRAGGVSDGQPFKFTDGVNYAIKMTESGSYTYIAYANPGTLDSEAKWKCMRLDDSAGLRVTYADGDTNFDNLATDLTSPSLNYS